jgi:hypothetical protein
MHIDFLYFEGCPNAAPGRAMLDRVLAELAIDAKVNEIEVADAADAARQRFPGSPTIRVDDRDIEPAAREDATFSFSCRLYGTGDSSLESLLRRALG